MPREPKDPSASDRPGDREDAIAILVLGLALVTIAMSVTTIDSVDMPPLLGILMAVAGMALTAWSFLRLRTES